MEGGLGLITEDMQGRIQKFFQEGSPHWEMT